MDAKRPVALQVRASSPAAPRSVSAGPKNADPCAPGPQPYLLIFKGTPSEKLGSFRFARPIRRGRCRVVGKSLDTPRGEEAEEWKLPKISKFHILLNARTRRETGPSLRGSSRSGLSSDQNTLRVRRLTRPSSRACVARRHRSSALALHIDSALRGCASSRPRTEESMGQSRLP